MIYVIAIWAVGFLVTYPALFAHEMDKWYNRNATEKDNRETMAICVWFALLPPFWLMCPFLTGFYYSGFRWK